MLFSILLAFCRQRIASVFHIVLIIFSVLLACLGVFSHISGIKRFLLVKTIQATTFQVYLHSLQTTSVKFLIPIH